MFLIRCVVVLLNWCVLVVVEGLRKLLVWEIGIVFVGLFVGRVVGVVVMEMFLLEVVVVVVMILEVDELVEVVIEVIFGMSFVGVV